MTESCPSISATQAAHAPATRATRKGLLGMVPLVFAAVAACGSDTSGPDCAQATPNTVEATTFAASLNVDIASLTKNNANVYFQDRVVGTGPLAEAGDAVRVSYTGWFADGSVFDASSSFPFILGLGQVIIGWDRGVEGMQVGGTRLLVLPPSVGYGLCDFRTIPGNSILVFEVQLIEIT